jgi:acyl-CoA thioesterase-1
MQRFLYLYLRYAATLGLLALMTAVNAQAMEQRLLVLGDSISAAYGMSLEEGWVAQLDEQLTAKDRQVAVINASISGETTGGALRRLPALLSEHKPDVVLIELGGNDGLRGFPVNAFRSNLAQLANLSADSGARVIIVPMEIPPNYGARYTASFREAFPDVADETNSLLSAFILDGVATDPALMQADGIHPTADAQAAMLENLLPTIEAALQ